MLLVAKALGDSGIGRWRLTCRAEDWAKEADTAKLRRVTPSTIVTAHLLPLNDDEASEVLASFGETEPEAFLERARRNGAHGFLENPLSLELLHKAVQSSGDWPATRYALFDKATLRLATELDPERVFDDRPSPAEIRNAAAEIMLYMLCTGAKAVWRSNAPKPEEGLLSTHDIPVEHRLVNWALDIPLFRGEGDVFAPAHKSIAEFLGAKALAYHTLLAGPQPTLPLSRGLALIAGSDGKAPSELRGLYAWLAAHLAKQGDEAGALRLIRQDASTVLAYGDAGAFSTEGRRLLLHNLDREDPYFRTSLRDSQTVVGGLAGSDLAEDFLEIIDATDTGHLLLTVFEALIEGVQVPELHEKLESVTFDETRPMWHRARASQAIIAHSDDPIATRAELVARLGAKDNTVSNFSLRAGLAAGLPPDSFGGDDIAALLEDFDKLPRKERRGFEFEDDEGTPVNLTSLMLEFEERPRPELFDRQLVSSNKPVLFETRYFLARALASAIRKSPDLSAERLWKWIQNTNEYDWYNLDNDVAKSVDQWLQSTPDRAQQLFWAIESQVRKEGGKSWTVRNLFVQLARRGVSHDIFASVFQKALSANAQSKRHWLFRICVDIVHDLDVAPSAHWTLLAQLEKEPRTSKLIKSMTSTPLRWIFEQLERKCKENNAQAVVIANNISGLGAILPSLEAGDRNHLGALFWAASHYKPDASADEDNAAGIINLSSPEIANALLEGCLAYAKAGEFEFDVAELGRVEAERKSFQLERVIAVGLHRALATGRSELLRDLSEVAVVVGLRQSYISSSKAPSLGDWAASWLNSNPHAGASILVDYWQATLAAGGEELDEAYLFRADDYRQVATLAFEKILRSGIQLPERAFREALELAGRHLPPLRLREIARDISREYPLDSRQRVMLNFVLLFLLPVETLDEIGAEAVTECLLTADGSIWEVFAPFCADQTALNRIKIDLLGGTVSPDADDWKSSTRSASSIVRNAIEKLSASPEAAAACVLSDRVESMGLAPWRSELAHALAVHKRAKLNSDFQSPTVEKLRQTLAGGGPANSTDLTAIIFEELYRYRETLRTSSETPWKSYWNTDKHGFATAPKIENEDRNILLGALRPRLELYGIQGSFPEALRGENTRADILLLGARGSNLPVEAKRHNNGELWTAVDDQLRGYANSEGANGAGVYLVFWFGTEFRLPPCPDGGTKPTTAADLQSRLIENLPEDLRGKVEVVVLDVSRPADHRKKYPVED